MIISVLSGFQFGCRNNTGTQQSLSSNYCTADFIDWSKSDSVAFSNPSESDNSTVVKSCWTVDSLYFLFIVKDSDLRAEQTEKDHTELFLDDMVEVLIDADYDRTEHWQEDDIIYHINILGAKKDDRGTTDYKSDATWDGDARYTIEVEGTINDSSDVDSGYSVEIAIPWSELGQNPYHGLKMGVNFANGDNDGKGRQLYSWQYAWPMRTPSCFGTLTLSGREEL